MIDVEELYHYLVEKDICYFTGVPDSQLGDFCNYITNKLSVGSRHIIPANEGNAIALASGYHMATGKVGLVYMQNSGLGNGVNPITSLTDPEVYGIPVLYMIGWRGQPGVKDEPQHIKQGKITLDLLKVLDIEPFIITKETTMAQVKQVYSEKFVRLFEEGKSAAFVVAKDAFGKIPKPVSSNTYRMTREEAVQIIVDCQEDEDVIVSTTGKTSRELFEYRETKKEGHSKDFLTVGSMGHASMIALSIAENSNKRVWCMDGDGAMLMHTGAAALIGNRKPERLIHILLNNGSHETVGGMPTISYSLEWDKAVLGFGYKKAYCVSAKEELAEVLIQCKIEKGPVFVEILVSSSSRDDLGRPSIKPIDNKKSIMEFIKG